MGSDNILQDVSNAVTSLGSLGIQCPEYIVKLFLDEGEDPLQEIPKIYRTITSAGHDCVAFFETVVTGCQQYGSPRAYLWHLATQAYNQFLPDLENVVKGWGASARPPMDMITEIDALLARYPGFGTTQGSQGAMASAFMGQYTTIKGNIQRAAVPMAVPIIVPLIQWAATYEPGLSDIWNKYSGEAQRRITSEQKDGSLGWRLGLVFFCIAMIGLDDVVIAALVVAVSAVTGGAASIGAVPIGAVEIAVWDLLWICAILAILNVFDLFIEMLVAVVNLLVSVTLTDIEQWVQHTFAVSGSAGAGSLTTDAGRQQAVNDAWNAIDQELAKLGKTMQDLIKIIGSEALVKQIIQLLACMGYSTAEIAQLLTSMVTNPALNTPYSLPAGASNTTIVGRPKTLMDVFNNLLDANAQGNQDAYDGSARLIKGIMDIGPGNVKGIDVAFKNSNGRNSDADIIDNNGDIYELGGDAKINDFIDQDMADNTFIKNGGTGDPNANIHLWMDDDNDNDINIAKGFYETGKPPDPRDPKDYGKYFDKNNYPDFKPADVTQKIPPAWQCGSHVVDPSRI